MTLTKADCLWYAGLYAFVGFGVGYWIRKLVSMYEAVKRIRDGASAGQAPGGTEMAPEEEAPTKSEENERWM